MARSSDSLARRERAGAVALDGALLRSLVADASSLLDRHVDALNAINVFPVPDGDTGTNLSLTLHAGVEALAQAPSDVGGAAHALARGALMGARGNSGVILSQVLRGFANGLDGERDADGPALARALSEAAKAAYAALSEPAEGTILTVAREAAEAVADAPPASAEAVLDEALAAAKAAVDRTPELLPVLKEAGVVDAGGLGLAIILEGLLRSLRGDALDVRLAPEQSIEAGWRSETASLHETGQAEEAGYCTEFVISSRGVDDATMRERLAAIGTSLLVVGGDGVMHVHLHTLDPDEALALGREAGELSHIKVENMEAQIRRFVRQEPATPSVAPGVDVVAVAAGAGIEAAFRSLGVSHLVQGGQSMNPSAGEIRDAIEACPADDIVVLPNNKNVIAAAEQAVEQSTKRAAVLPTRSIPQGVAAVLALNPDLEFDANIDVMRAAAESVRSAEVTRAVRSTTIEGRQIAAGQAIGIIDGSLRVVADDVADAALRCVDEMNTQGAALLTVYAGEDVREPDVEGLLRAVRDRHPEIETELVRGDQPHYAYLLSLE